MGPIISLIIAEIPDIVQAIKNAHAAANPEADPITSQQVIEAFNQLFIDSFARDEALKIALLAEIDAQE